MSLREDQYYSNQSAYYADQQLRQGLANHQRRELAEYLQEDDATYCPYCGELIINGDDVIDSDDGLAHWECWKQKNGGLV